MNIDYRKNAIGVIITRNKEFSGIFAMIRSLHAYIHLIISKHVSYHRKPQPLESPSSFPWYVSDSNDSRAGDN